MEVLINIIALFYVISERKTVFFVQICRSNVLHIKYEILFNLTKFIHFYWMPTEIQIHSLQGRQGQTKLLKTKYNFIVVVFSPINVMREPPKYCFLTNKCDERASKIQTKVSSDCWEKVNETLNNKNGFQLYLQSSNHGSGVLLLILCCVLYKKLNQIQKPCFTKTGKSYWWIPYLWFKLH